MNIVINNICNQSCEYCFANKVIEEDKRNMSYEDYKYCLDFLQKNNMKDIRLIGGEPTLHPKFGLFITQALNKGFKDITIFTNGTFDESVLDILLYASKNARLNIIINFNHKLMVGEKNYQKTVHNIKELVNHCNLVLGVNIYKPNQDINFYTDIIKKYSSIKNVRFSYVVPNTEGKQNIDLLSYFKSLQPVATALIKACFENNTQIHFSPDCNNIPLCMLEDDLLRLFAMIDTRLLKPSICKPVLDIKPNLDVIRCFAISDNIVNLKKANTIKELVEHFESNDKKFDNNPIFEQCKKCTVYLRNNRSCTCLAYRKEE